MFAQSYDDVVVNGRTSVYAVDGKFGGAGGLPAVSLDLNMCPKRQLVVKRAVGRFGCCGRANNGPDGRTVASGFDVDTMNGLSAWNATRGIALVGAFLSGPSSEQSAPPGHIDYGLSGFDADQYRPRLGQVFFLGDGYAQARGWRQVFEVPDGATRLVLGVIDRTPDGKPGHYFDNAGAVRLDLIVAGCASLIS